MKLYIKNMVCNRCIMVVRQKFEKVGFKPLDVKMGEVELNKAPSESQLKKINSSMNELGFEILDNQRQKQIERIKNLLIEKIQTGEIEEHFILQEIEKVKEWIAYDELTLSEIVWKLGYSSVVHLSSQFKKITGLNPSLFKKLGVNHRKLLDNI